MAAYSNDRSLRDGPQGRLVDNAVIPLRWQHALERVDAQANAYGIPIQMKECLLDIARHYFQRFLYANSQGGSPAQNNKRLRNRASMDNAIKQMKDEVDRCYAEQYERENPTRRNKRKTRTRQQEAIPREYREGYRTIDTF